MRRLVLYRLLCDGALIKESLASEATVKEHLLDLPDSLYTTMRMAKSGQVIELEQHLGRLKIDKSNEEDVSRLLQLVMKEQNPERNRGLRLTMIRKSLDGEIQLLVEEMPTMGIESCQIEFRLAKRSNVKEKNSEWVRLRQSLEASMDRESNEIVMMDEMGQLYEGLSSNFFVLRSDDRLQTAPPSSVLFGTMMGRILGLWSGEVLFSHPGVEEIQEWRGAFISSTSRLLLPIKAILRSNGQRTEIPQSPVIAALRRQLLESLTEADERERAE